MIAVMAGFIVLAGFGAWQWRRVEVQKNEIASRETNLRGLLEQVEAHLDAPAVAALPPAEQAVQRTQDVQLVRTSFEKDFPAIVAAKPGPDASRDALLNRGVHYLDRAHATPVKDSHLDSEVAAAYQQFGILQENTADPKAHGREDAVKTYQKASTVLAVIASENPDDVAARERLAMVNQRITALGGETPAPVQADTAPVVAPEPEKVVLPPAPTPVRTSVAPPAPVVSAPPTDPAPPPQIAPPPPAAPAGMSAAVRAELNDRMLSATSKVQIAEQTIEPIRQSLVQRGQTLNTDTQASMAQMRARLARAKTDIAAGDVDAARDDLASAEAYAARVMRVAGR
jgi:hypothetical protein